MKRTIDIENWNRKEHYHFFSSMDDPFFGITALVDATNIYKEAKADKASFFLYSLHKILQAVNSVEEFRYRIENNKVICHDTIHAGSTIGREDGTFGFGFFQFHKDRSKFTGHAQQEIERVQALSGLCYTDNERRTDIIRFSPIPWITFTDMKHPASFRNGDSAPKISTGKLIHDNNKWMLPVSVTAHHGLMDGKHVSDLLKAIESFEQ